MATREVEGHDGQFFSPCSALTLARRLSVIALAACMAAACGGGGATDADGTDTGEGGDDGQGNGSSTGAGSSEGGQGTGAGSQDCNGNPTEGQDLPDVVNQVSGVEVSTLAGSATPGSDDGAGDEAQFNNPANIVIEASGNLLVADYDGGLIRRVTPDGEVSTVVAQSGFARPFGMVLLSADELLVQTDYDSSGQSAGATGGVVWSVDLGTGTAEPLITEAGRPRGLLDLNGEIIASDIEGMTLRVLDPDSAAMSDLAGAAGCPSWNDGSGSVVRFNRPYGMVALDGGDILVADMMNHRIRRVSRDGSVSTFAGDGVADMVDGAKETARFNMPKDLAIDSAGNVYVTDTGNHRIRRISASGMVETIAGNGSAGYADGDGGDAKFFGQEGIEVTADGGTIYVADGTDGEVQPYHRIRKITVP